MKEKIALYMRLSNEDDRNKESASIINQRNLLHDFIQNNSEFTGCKIIEFTDDGCSGTNFDRPAVKALLEQAKKGEINCIIVKDFSRFGRNFIEVGDFIEQVFPSLNVRFIAVNNNFDSKDYAACAGALDMAFRNLINELYSRDISKKVKSAKRTKMKNGDFMSGGAPFGYRKSSENKNKLEIDPAAAEYVRRVFSLCADGKSTNEIASVLNAEDIPTPLMYKRSIGNRRKWNIKGEKNIWTNAAVLRVLRDERYTGNLVSGKREIKKIGSGKSVKVPQKDWIIIENTHEPIISKKLFNKARERLGKKREYAAQKPVLSADILNNIISGIKCKELQNENENEKIKKAKITLYEKYKSNKISREAYIAEREKLVLP